MRHGKSPTGRWAIPENMTPSERMCFCLNWPRDPEHIAIFWGMLYDLAYRYNWGEPLTSDSDTMAAFYSTVIEDNRACYEESLAMANSGCGGCPDVIFRYDPLTGLRERSEDDGATWESDLSDPRLTGSVLPPPPWLLLPGDHECEGATTGRINMEFLLDQIFNIGIDIGVSGVAGAIITIICAIAPPACLAAGLVGSIALALIQIGAALLQAAMTETVYEQFKCILFCHIEPDATFTVAGWQAVKSDITEQFDSDAEFLLWTIVNVLGPVGLADLCRQSISVVADCSECVCDPCENAFAFVGTLVDHPSEFVWEFASADDGFGQQAILVRFGGGTDADCCCISNVQIAGFAPFESHKLCGQAGDTGGNPGVNSIWQYRRNTGVGGAQFGMTLTVQACPE